jgi:hypothetical protein
MLDNRVGVSFYGHPACRHFLVGFFAFLAQAGVGQVALGRFQ